MRTRSGNGQYRASEGWMYLAPAERWASPGGLSILYSPGYDGNANRVQGYSSGGTRQMLGHLGERYQVLSVDAGGLNTFGNDAAIEAVDQAVSWAQPTFGMEPPYLLVGGSMGFADLLAWGRGHQDQVAGAIGLAGLTDLTAAWSTPFDLGGGIMSTTAINTAYGGLYDPAAHGPTHDPMQYATSLGFPIHYWYATDDALVPFSWVEGFAAAAPDCTLHSAGAVGHTHLLHATAKDDQVFDMFISSLTG